jgi:hypothetical protein
LPPAMPAPRHRGPHICYCIALRCSWVCSLGCAPQVEAVSEATAPLPHGHHAVVSSALPAELHCAA